MREPPIYTRKFCSTTYLCKKEIHVIKDAPHTFREQKHLEEIKQLLMNWIEENEN